MSKFAGTFYTLTVSVLVFVVPPFLVRSGTVGHLLATSCDGGQLALKNEFEAIDDLTSSPAKARLLYRKAAKVWFTCAHTTSDEYVQGWARVFWSRNLYEAAGVDADLLTETPLREKLTTGFRRERHLREIAAQMVNALSNLIHDTKYPDIRDSAKQELVQWKNFSDILNATISLENAIKPTCYDAVISNVSGDAYWPVTEIQILDTRDGSNRYYKIQAQYWDRTKDWSVDDSVFICETDEPTNSHQPVYRIENEDKATVAWAVEE